MKNIFTKAGKEYEKGLSLIEVLITIAVLAIVAAISLPIITASIQRTQIDAHKSEMLLTADTIKSSIAGMGGVRIGNDPNFNLGGGTIQSYIRINAKQDTRFRFDRQNENAFYTVSPSRVTRIVSIGQGTQEDPYTGFCLTAWVGDVNLELYSNSTQVTEYTKDADPNLPCGLKPGPISVPAPPTLSPSGAMSVLSDTVATVAFNYPSGDDVGGEDWTGLEIVEARVTCTSSDGGQTRIVTDSFPRSTITITGLTPQKIYSCTVAARNDGFVTTDPNAWSDESETTDSFYMPNAPLAVITPGVGDPGVQINLSWGLETDPYAFPAGYSVNDPWYGGRMLIDDYEISYLKGCNADNTLNIDTRNIPVENPDLQQVRTGPLATNNYNLTVPDHNIELGEEYYVWIRAINDAGPEETPGNYVGFGQVRDVWSAVGCAKTGTIPSVMITSSTQAEQSNAISGSTDLSGYLEYTWLVASPTGTGTASAWFNGGLPITHYEWQIDLSPDFDSTEGDGKYVGTVANGKQLTHSGEQYIAQKLNTKEQNVPPLPTSTVYYLQIRACNQLGCQEGWNNPPAQGATSSTPPPPESVNAEVDENGNAVVTWSSGN
jgi:prepilin-type N-terminal cleavage/methylation domain-containing protein